MASALVLRIVPRAPNTCGPLLVVLVIGRLESFDSESSWYCGVCATIGYDAPWRQVHALLLQAAERTPGLRTVPRPLVLQASLEDFYVKYMLLVCLEQQQARPLTLNALHANIQDLFNEAGVQIMSPNYVLDPAAPKVVPKDRWFAAPAAVELSGVTIR